MIPSCKNRISLHIEIICHVARKRAIFKLTERWYYRLAVTFRCFMAKKDGLHIRVTLRNVPSDDNVPRKTCFLPYF